MKKASAKVTQFMELLEMENVAALYKHFSGVTQVKFKDRQDAEQRLLTVTFGKPRHLMIEAFKATGIDKETIGQYGTMLRGPIAFPEGTMSAKDMKKHAEALSKGKKADGEKKEGRINGASLSVLLALQELIPVGAEGDEAQKDSTKIAEHLKTNPNTVIKAVDQLVKQELVGFEDDSPDDGTFYWLWLTDKGRSFSVPVASSGKPPVKLPGSNPGPRSGNGGRLIYKLVTGNPRREGSAGWKSFSLIKDGMTFEEYRKAGGRNTDLAWDIKHGFTTTINPGDPIPKVKGSAAPEAPKKEEKAAAPPEVPLTKGAKKIEKLKKEIAAKSPAKKKKGKKK